MAFAFIADSGGQSADTNTVTSGTINSTGATVLFALVAVVAGSSAGIGVADSNSNSGWTLDFNETNGSNRQIMIFRCNSPASVGAGHTAHTTGTTGLFPSIDFYAFSGAIATSPLDQTSGAAAASTTSVAPGTVTPTVANELVLTAVVCAGTPSIGGGGSTTNGALLASNGNAVGLGTAWIIQTSATAFGPTWSATTSSNIAALTATYELVSTSAGNMFLAMN